METHVCLPICLTIKTMGLNIWEFPQESSIWKSKRPPSRDISYFRERFHAILTMPQTTLQDETTLQDWDVDIDGSIVGRITLYLPGLLICTHLWFSVSTVTSLKEPEDIHDWGITYSMCSSSFYGLIEHISLFYFPLLILPFKLAYWGQVAKSDLG